MPNIEVQKTTLNQIQTFRSQFLNEHNFQIRYDACHIRGWADEYLLKIGAVEVGYGSVKGKEDYLNDRDAIFEFYIIPPYRKWLNQLFDSLIQISKSQFIECQSNDSILTSLLYEFTRKIYSDTILFEDHITTNYEFSHTLFRLRKEQDDVFGKSLEDAGQYVLERDGKIVADGGFLTHYNKPFADLYMEVRSDCQRQGLGSYILQELKAASYQAGRVPAARCNIKNKASKATLIKAGFRVCGYMLTGEISDIG